VPEPVRRQPGAARAPVTVPPLLPLLLALLLAVTAATASAQGRSPAVPGDDPRFSRGDELVQLDFKDVELAVVIETIARITGKNFIYDDRVRGRVTIVSPSEVTVEQAYAVFESVLKIKGFTAVPGPGGVQKIVPIRDAKESSIDTVRGDAPSANRDTFVTRLVPLLYIDAEAITNTIKPMTRNVSLRGYRIVYACQLGEDVAMAGPATPGMPGGAGGGMDPMSQGYDPMNDPNFDPAMMGYPPEGQ